MPEHNPDKIYFRWLGTAGIEIHAQNKILLIDPYTTREPVQKVLFGKIKPNKPLVKQIIPRADYILVTHSHFDHLSDVSAIMSYTDAVAAGSENTFKILSADGIPEDKIIQINAEKTIQWPAFTITSSPIIHVKIPGYGYGKIKKPILFPIKASAYKMDIDYQYKITIGKFVFMTDIGKENTVQSICDVLFLFPIHSEQYVYAMLQRIETKNIVFIH